MATYHLEAGVVPASWAGARQDPMRSSRRNCNTVTPTISMDYMFLGSEDSEERSAPIVAKTMHGTKSKTARVAPKKGAVSKVAELEARDISNWGRKRFIFKTDQEPALIALRDRIIELLGPEFEIVPEVSAIGESESNGTIERAVRALGGLIRTLKVSAQQSFNCALESGSPVLEWLIQYAGFLLSRFEVGADRKTPHERERGKPYRAKLPTFGEYVFYRPLKATGARLNKLDPRFREGVYLGVRGRDERILHRSCGWGRPEQ